MLLDSKDWYLPDLEQYNIHIELFKEANWGSMMVYNSSPDLLEYISNNSMLYDLIIVGNNNGSGIAKAKRICDSKKSSTIIVWNLYRPGDEVCYRQLGFNRFASRVFLEDEVMAHLGIKA